MRSTVIAIAAAVSALAAVPMLAPAGAAPLSVRDSFRIGTAGTIFCSAQSLATDPGLKDMFDAGYSLTCRDAASPVGKLYKLREAADVGARLSAVRDQQAVCSAPRT